MDIVPHGTESGEFDLDFTHFEYPGFCDKDILARLQPFVRGRWTPKSLYFLYLNGLDSGSLEVALNSVGLMTEDLQAEEIACANRAYLMARARTLAQVKKKLEGSSDNAKEAEVLLTKVYGISDTENKILGTGFNVSIMNEVSVDTTEDEDIDLIDGREE